ncbi:MAG: hypothetical protein L0387_28420 [Acidobacteria bacterium]|nr:hypothetical protein [Acidobacteriota bacterium]
MSCPYCGTKLSLIHAVLAETSVGTQCPTCGSFLSKTILVKAPPARKSTPKSGQTHRAA